MDQRTKQTLLELSDSEDFDGKLLIDGVGFGGSGRS